MPGVKGRITRSKKGKRVSVYVSDKFGLWPEDGRLKVTFLARRGAQSLHTNLTPEDGLLYDAMMMLYAQGMREGEGLAD